MITLGETTIKMLRQHAGILGTERKEAGEAWRENDLVFPSSTGTPWDHRNVHKSYKRFLKGAGLPDFPFHDLRHTAAILMLKEGVNPKIVQERLGHSDITLTLNTYSHVLPSMQDEAAEKLDELLTPIDVSEAIKKLGERRGSYAPGPS